MVRKPVAFAFIMACACFLFFSTQQSTAHRAEVGDEESRASARPQKLIGIVEHVDFGARIIIVRNKINGERSSYAFNDNTTVTLSGKKGNSSVLKKGDEVSMKVDATKTVLDINVWSQKTE